MNPLQKLHELGQSVWLDYIRRDLYTTDRLQTLIHDDRLMGMTTNPTIFQKAVADTELYDSDIRKSGGSGLNPATIFECLSIEDVRHAADEFRPVFEATGGNDGFVSIEVGPHLARDTQGSIAEARRLWKECARPNVMVKIPGTREGIPAIRQCLSEQININITLLFSVDRYREVINAYFTALEARVDSGLPIDRVRSVASFFVSRVDTNTDKKLDQIVTDPLRSDDEKRRARELRGKFAIANARIAYQLFEESCSSSRFGKLKIKGAQVQRPLWASTSTKDPTYPELYYVEALIAPLSVDTMPLETLEAYRVRGDPKIRIFDELPEAHAISGHLSVLGIDTHRIALELEEDGIRKFSNSYDELLKAVEEKEKAISVG